MTKNEPIAIVGSGCRFAGGVDTPSKLWHLLRRPRDIRCQIPLNRFNVEGFYHHNGAYHGHTNVKYAYAIDQDLSHFDAEFFGIKPSEAKSIDPQQRLLLEVVYESIEAAGMTIAGLGGSDTAVYAGLMTNDYEMMLARDLAQVPTYHATGISSAIVSNRISYFFDWHGPSVTVQTACSSSLVALHLAVQSLRNGESHMALACGTNLMLGPEFFISESKLNMLSPDGRCKMWDKEANGYARGDGVAVVVLKTLSRALADGDHIESIIRETGVNQDGSTPGITMPSATAQAGLIRSTYAKAGLDLRDPSNHPSYFEAHGTGTPAGDPIEAEAISTAFFGKRLANGHDQKRKDHPLYVGSIKTVLGHTEGSAGIAAILKASLALQNSTIPPNFLFNQLNENVAPFYENLEIVRAARPWPELATGQARRASVNSFGFGGSNAHVILESYQPPCQDINRSTYAARPLFTPFVFSATSEKSLKATISSYRNYLSDGPDINLQDLAWTLRQRRADLPFRASFSANCLESLVARITERLNQDWPSIGMKVLPSSQPDRRTGILGVFTGQGAQYARMGADLIEQSPLASRIIENLESMLQELPVNERPSWFLRTELLANNDASRVHQAAISQPLCTAVQIMLIDLLQAAKVDFSAVVGHSSGEIAAAYAAGFLTAREAIYIAYYRGFHLGAATSPSGKGLGGAMLAVGMTMDHASRVCARDQFAGRVSVAASNSSSSVTLSGDEDAIAELQVIFDSQGTFNRRLKVDRAYHSAHMRPCSSVYIRSLQACIRERQVQKIGSSCIWYSSVSHKAIDAGTGVTCDYWAENMTRPVLFSQAFMSATTECDFDIVIEVGAHPALRGSAKQIINEMLSTREPVPYFWTLSRNSSAVDSLSTLLGQIWCTLGSHHIELSACEIALSGIHTARHNVVKGLPSYPWDHGTGYWHEARASRHLRQRNKPVHPLLGNISTDSSTHCLRWRHLLRVREMEWLSGHAIQGQVVFPAAGYICSALEGSRLLASDIDVRLIELVDFIIHHAIVLPEDDAGVEVLIEFLHSPTARSDRLEAKFTYSAALGQDVQTLTLVASATVVVKLGLPSHSLLSLRSPAATLAHAVSVDTESFYSALADLGYDFGGRFRSLCRLLRRYGRSSALFRAEPSDSEFESLLIHPAELDGVFQAILLACSYPYDEQLRVLHLPTTIRLIRVNPALCSARDIKSSHFLPIEGVINPGADGETGNIIGDATIFSPDCSNGSGMIQVQGAKHVPFTGEATEKDDRQLFSAIQWVSNRQDGSNYITSSQHHHDAMRMMERISAAYLRQFDRQLPANHPSRSEYPFSFYIGYARHITSIVDDGKHRYATEEWREDTPKSVINASTTYSNLPDVRLMHLVGEHMPRILQGETTMWAEFHKSDILGDYYMNGIVMQESASWIIGMMRQITDRAPHLNILEIGKFGIPLQQTPKITLPQGSSAGEDAASNIPRNIDHRFLHYTYATLASSIAPDGTAFFSRASDPKPTRTFDATLELAGQGYVEGSYDVIIAFWVMHAMKDLVSFLRSLRKLLKPGGFLLVAEGTYTASGADGGLTFIFGTLGGWWSGADKGRTVAPYLSIEEWDQALILAGFSGFDVSPPKHVAETFGARLFLSQAINEQVSFLRDPLALLPNYSSLFESLVIIGGHSSRSLRLVVGIMDIFSSTYGCIHQFQTLETIDFSVITPQTTVISFVELDEPVFFNLTEGKFSALKQMFGHGKKLVWITSGRLDNQPYSNLTLGFGRSAVVETPDLLLQQLDVADPSAINAHDIARIVLRFMSTIPETTLWDTEPEIILDHSRCELIPRLKPIRAFNNRYNSSARVIKQPVRIDGCDIALKVTDHGWRARGVITAQYSKLESEIDLVTMYSTSHAIKTAAGYQYLVLLLPTGVVLFIGLSTSESEMEINEETITTCLHKQCLRENSSTIFTCESLPNAVSTADILRNAINKIESYKAAQLIQARTLTTLVHVHSVLSEGLPNDPLSIIDWTTSCVLPITIEGADTQREFRSDRTYWIIGLSPALGASLIDWMIRQGAKNFVYTSRQPRLDDDWIHSHGLNGVKIKQVACDLTHEVALETAYKEICAECPPIAGVLNGAAVFRDVSILDMSFSELQESLAPKVKGSLNLDNIFYDQSLEFFILTSSMTGLLGSERQANYAAANTFMCSLAAQRRRRGLAATAVNLGPIAGLGMMERGDKKALEFFMRRYSLMPVSEMDFHQIIAEAIEAGRPDCVVCGPELSTALRPYPIDEPGAPGFFSNPIFSHFLLPGSDSQRVKGPKISSFKNLLAVCNTKVELQKIIEGAFASELRKILDTTMTDDKLLEMRSIDLGIDSLVSIDLRTWFSKNLKVDIPVLKIMANDPTRNLVLFAVEHIPEELAPLVTDRGFYGESTEVMSHEVRIDWDVETTPPADLAEVASTSVTLPCAALVPNTVILTGASGFLGSHILQTLLETPSIKKIHCLAIRGLSEKLKKGLLPRDARVDYYEGELDQPRLGLSEEATASIFLSADAVIHNGADTSHLKTYFDLKPYNIGSTTELVRLCLPRRIPFHFVSSNSVGRYSNKLHIGEAPIYTPGALEPATDGSSGYRSTKWAIERLLERVHESTRLPIWIHRPSTIIRSGRDATGQAAELDWMNALIWYMDKLSAVPKLNHGTGFLNMVHPETVSAGIVSQVMSGASINTPDTVSYVHHMADLLIPLSKLEDFSKADPNREFRYLSREEWITEAVAAGLHPAVVVLIEMMDDPSLKGPPMFVKGAGSQEPFPNRT
ncbi:hypothetical protein RRF57_008028 [Xylaria bambusicola]|uniref:Carrier domain-containing protein n=1 Tax=Xylaria bambusicola TaxID=326684 RepID=A0AAN7Z6Q9_9PEZI